VARIALKNPTTVNVPVEASTKTEAIGRHFRSAGQADARRSAFVRR
jgi:hypothetical protein